MRRLSIIGAGGHAKVMVAMAVAAGIEHIELYDDGAVTDVLGYLVQGGIAALPDIPDTQAVIAIGGNAIRRRIAQQFAHVTWVSLVHPHSWIAPDVVLGAGSVVMAGSMIQPGARLGQHVIVNTAASVDHDCRLADFVHVAPGTRLAGGVQLDEGVFTGVGSVHLPGTHTGAWSIVGAGGVVQGDLPANTTAVGVPARVIKERSPGWHLS